MIQTKVIVQVPHVQICADPGGVIVIDSLSSCIFCTSLFRRSDSATLFNAVLES